MELFLDTGNLKDIKVLSTILPIDGVTTNPTIVAKEGKKITELLDEIVQAIGEEKVVHAQVLSRDFEGMITLLSPIIRQKKGTYEQLFRDLNKMATLELE